MEPIGKLHLYAFTFTFYCTNNQAEYNALVLGLQLAQQHEVWRLLIRGDSLLVIHQVTGVLAIHEPYTLGYKRQLDRLISHLPEVQFERIAQSSNKMADALAVLGSRFNNDEGLVGP